MLPTVSTVSQRTSRSFAKPRPPHKRSGRPSTTTKRVLDYLRSQQRDGMTPPLALGDIQYACGLNSTAHVAQILTIAAKRGQVNIIRDPKPHRYQVLGVAA